MIAESAPFVYKSGPLLVSIITDMRFLRESNGSLRVNVTKDQSRCFQGSVDLADFHMSCSVFYADSHGAIRFS